jgi:hypothetical protein
LCRVGSWDSLETVAVLNSLGIIIVNTLLCNKAHLDRNRIIITSKRMKVDISLGLKRKVHRAQDRTQTLKWAAKARTEGKTRAILSTKLVKF